MEADRDLDDSAASELERKLLAGEITHREAEATALEAIKEVAQRLAEGTLDPGHGALAIYQWAWHAGAWRDDDPSELRQWGSCFVQLHDALEPEQAHLGRAAADETLTIEFARALLDGASPPDWLDRDRVGDIDTLSDTL
jgi:hypothetical protein